MTKQDITATGRRKRSVAAVRLRSGGGRINVNGRELAEYFPKELQRKALLAPLELLNLTQAYDLIVRIKGGGLIGQSMATRLGIARALVKENEERRVDLKANGFLTRDSRRRERKKYGRKGARKSFQFSKR